MKKSTLIIVLFAVISSCTKEDIQEFLGTGFEMTFDNVTTTDVDGAIVFSDLDVEFITGCQGNIDPNDQKYGAIRIGRFCE